MWVVNFWPLLLYSCYYDWHDKEDSQCSFIFCFNVAKKIFFFCPVPRCLANLSVDPLGSRDRNIPVPFKSPVPSLTVSKRLDY